MTKGQKLYYVYAMLAIAAWCVVLHLFAGCAVKPVLTTDAHGWTRIYPGTEPGNLSKSAVAAGALPAQSITLGWSNQQMWVGNVIEGSDDLRSWRRELVVTNGANFECEAQLPATNQWRVYRVGAFYP